MDAGNIYLIHVVFVYLAPNTSTNQSSWLKLNTVESPLRENLLGQRQVSSEYRLGCLTQHKIYFWRTDDQGLCKNLNTDKSTDCYRVH